MNKQELLKEYYYECIAQDRKETNLPPWIVIKYPATKFEDLQDRQIKAMAKSFLFAAYCFGKARDEFARVVKVEGAKFSRMLRL